MKSALFGLGKIGEWLREGIRNGRSRLWALLLLPLLLTGCVDYDVGIHFDSQTHGEIVQHVVLGERLKAFSSSSAEAWLDSIERRTRQLRGKVKRISDREIVVRIPFNNGAQLVEKFNDFFNPGDRKMAAAERSPEGELPQISSVMKLKQRNFLLAIYNELNYELDLRSLGVISANGNAILSPGALLDLEFALNAPWGATAVPTPGVLTPEVRSQGRQLVWTLVPGELNRIETRFWVPSPIGIGGLAIVLLVAIGSFFKYQLLPAIGIGKRKPTQPKTPQPETENVAS